jgi:hypothetical protein
MSTRLRFRLAAFVSVGFGCFLAASVTTAAQEPVDIRTFVTRSPVNGLPYAQSRAYGTPAIPALFAMLRDRSMEDHWDKIITGLHRRSVGNRGAVGLPQVPTREISVQAFKATLAVLPSLGHVARGGDNTAFTTLVDYTRPDQWE